MKAWELTQQKYLRKFKLKNGKVIWTHARMNGDRRCVCVSRMEKGVEKKRYISPHSEVVFYD